MTALKTELTGRSTLSGSTWRSGADSDQPVVLCCSMNISAGSSLAALYSAVPLFPAPAHQSETRPELDT